MYVDQPACNDLKSKLIGSAKDVDDLLNEVEDLTLTDDKLEDKPKKDKKKVLLIGVPSLRTWQRFLFVTLVQFLFFFMLLF
jgi:hypothetical protein